MYADADSEPMATLQENTAPVPIVNSEKMKKPAKKTEDEPSPLSIKERFEKISKLVKQPRFESVLLAPNRHMDTLSFAYLKACFLSLLEALNLYTSTRKRFLENMNEAVDKPQKLDSALIVRFGLFIQPDQSQVRGIPEQTDTAIVALQ